MFLPVSVSAASFVGRIEYDDEFASGPAGVASTAAFLVSVAGILAGLGYYWTRESKRWPSPFEARLVDRTKIDAADHGSLSWVHRRVDTL
jgi:hypothetical protein